MPVVVPAVIRASSGPKAMLCPGSVRATGVVEIDREHEAGPMGTAAHEVFALYVAGDAPTVQWHARKHNVDETELSVLSAYARRAWGDISAQFPDPLTEVHLTAEIAPGVTLSGHLDLLSTIRTQKRAHICDLKTGRLDANYLPQLMLYVVLVVLNDPEIEEVDACILWLRDSQIERYHVTRAEALAWLKVFVERVVMWDGVFHPGGHCAFCKRSHDCPAMTALARRDLEIFAGPELAARIENGLADLRDDEIVALRKKAKVIEAVLASLDEATRAVVRKRGGALDGGDGTQLKFVPVERRVIDTAKSWDVLTARFTADEMAKGVDVKISRFNDMAKEKAPARGGAKAIRELTAALEEAGAVSTRIEEHLKLLRKA